MFGCSCSDCKDRMLVMQKVSAKLMRIVVYLYVVGK
jgi:hypothetical protein